ncbi:type II CRISPR RNA-guided endonuclease Cas9 [Mesoflavibacter sp. CH_XMU1422-2]|uniref:type II CRISPR RNA-guided endonuclease Cas9 n=1 Tax=Mesoflavibacter sp. CH_XMU1422-2 TaxID=3107770 RepID=UPI00300ADC20
MAKVLGLDLGTNSIGWAIVEKNQEINKLEDKGVLIFSQGVKSEKGQEKSKAAERTSFRSARRIKFRRKIRKYETLLVLAKHNMCPLSVGEVKEWRKSNFKKYPTKPEFLEWLRTNEDNNVNPYYFRDKASREKVSKYELGRAFYHIAQRRGFLSNRLDQSDDNLIKSKKDEIQSIIDNISLNKIDLIDFIESVFETYEFKEKKKKDCTNATEEKLWSIRYFIIKKLNDKKLSTQEAVKDIDQYINKPENLGAVQGNISELNTAIAEANCKTLGQYFWKLYQQDRNDAKNKIRNNYTSREEHYLDEFEIICKTQGLDGINEAKKDPSERYSAIVKELYKAIFYQRPLKSQKGLIGKCSLEPNRVRCSVSRPEYELFRMYSFINTIKLKESTAENFRFLRGDEIENIKSKFFRKSKPTFLFVDIKKTLGDENSYNYKDNATVSGCPTISALISVFGNDWVNTIYENYTDKTIRNIKNDKSEEVKTEEEVIADVWHVLSTFTSDEKLIDFAKNKLQLDEKKAEKFSKIHLKKDYASLSLYAIKKILPYLENGLLYSHAVFMANMEKVIKPERWKNKEDRELIEKEIGNIINKYQEENKMLFAVNSALKICFNNHQTYSKEAEKLYKGDIEKQLKKEFGIKTWENKTDKIVMFEEAFNVFKEHLKERSHPAIKRIDEKIKDFLSDNDLLKTNALDKLYHPSDIEKFKPTIIKDKKGNEYIGLGSPDVGSIKNPMAMKALHQLKKLINTLILEGKIDENTKINIELSRQLNDANKRKAIKKWQDDRKELYETYEKKIKELYRIETGEELKEVTDTDIEKFSFVLEQRKDGKLVSKEDVLKYTLWKEQNHICIYTGKTISLSSFLGANPQFDIEHTLPRSRSWDNSRMNKTLCDKAFNQKNKGNKMPFELQMNDEILPRIQHWKDKYEALANDIEKKKRSTRGATDKDQKDKLIQERHYLKMEHDYWKGKYDRFVMEEIKAGFKNSQAVDIGIISKYSRAYLKSVFKKVYSVKGEMVSEYRKAWGLHDTFIDKRGRTQYKTKDRSNHIHHCIDAVTIACMNKSKYDKLAHAWGLEDKEDYTRAKKTLEKEKPWDTFTQDVLNLENEVFIVHQSKDVLPIQTKKKFRKRGKIQRNKNKKIIYQQGDTVRGSLHLDTFYGAIAKDNNGEVKKDEAGNIKPNYVVRKELTKLKKTEVAKIVDNNIRAIVEQAAKDGLIKFNNNGAKVNETIWQNKDKHIPLKKVRIFTPTVKSPLKDFKKHPEHFRSKKLYKQQYNVVNDENYCMAIYEGINKRGKLKRDFELVNNIDAGEYYKLSNKTHRTNHDLVPNPHLKSELPLKYILKKGMTVLMYDKHPDEIWELTDHEKTKRLYKIIGFEGDGRIQFRLHQTAMQQSSMNVDEMTIVKYMKENELKNSEINFKTPVPWLRLTKGNLNFIVNNVDFKIKLTGKIESV